MKYIGVCLGVGGGAWDETAAPGTMAGRASAPELAEAAASGAVDSQPPTGVQWPSARAS